MNMNKSITLKQIIPLSVLFLIGCTGISWLTSEILSSQAVAAQTAEINLPIARQGEETYEDFLHRAEATAKQTIQSRFGREPEISELRVVIFGENQGAIAPVLSLKVSRNSWKTSPNIQNWATYYPDSEFLLGFEQQIVQPQLETPPAEQTQPLEEPTQQQPTLPPEQQSPPPVEEPQEEQTPLPFRQITPGQQTQPEQ
jgi:hypothetical protein